eukprot:4804847-Amphidinium_carterae.1
MASRGRGGPSKGRDKASFQKGGAVTFSELGGGLDLSAVLSHSQAMSQLWSMALRHADEIIITLKDGTSQVVFRGASTESGRGSEDLDEVAFYVRLMSDDPNYTAMMKAVKALEPITDEDAWKVLASQAYAVIAISIGELRPCSSTTQ